MKLLLAASALLVAVPAMAQHEHHNQESRQAEVARRGADVMPFDLSATTHVFTRTANGGTQRVLAKDAGNATQVSLVRAHLREIAAQFGRRDFAGPAHIHGAAMPGLAELQQAKAGELAIDYSDVPGGAELTYSTNKPELVAALHRWFDAQVSDHGEHAMAGHEHH